MNFESKRRKQHHHRTLRDQGKNDIREGVAAMVDERQAEIDLLAKTAAEHLDENRFYDHDIFGDDFGDDFDDDIFDDADEMTTRHNDVCDACDDIDYSYDDFCRDNYNYYDEW